MDHHSFPSWLADLSSLGSNAASDLRLHQSGGSDFYTESSDDSAGLSAYNNALNGFAYPRVDVPHYDAYPEYDPSPMIYPATTVAWPASEVPIGGHLPDATTDRRPALLQPRSILPEGYRQMNVPNVQSFAESQVAPQAEPSISNDMMYSNQELSASTDYDSQPIRTGATFQITGPVSVTDPPLQRYLISQLDNAALSMSDCYDGSGSQGNSIEIASMFGMPFDTSSKATSQTVSTAPSNLTTRLLMPKAATCSTSGAAGSSRTLGVKVENQGREFRERADECHS
ncbi:hypothetical protein QFC20_005667 [Naganishia adeliensis]|uniref:Uncharacterized protein n=1 Tax=Naganishia adeliensis TaxID=92952 RepID=A0ACC2VLA0_9TREE|nr:hypothetical protein QFC20_005667 [Naganishia adeliensis]